MKNSVRHGLGFSMLVTFTGALLMSGSAACRKSARPLAAHEGAGSSVVAAAASAALKPPGEAKVGDRTTCAMHSDSVFTVTETTPKSEYQGRTYYFCCPECAAHFAKNPSDFVK
jgi:YHS domain-containing protein